MKTKYDNEPKAIMDFGYNAKLILSLSVAHQIQTLLQHAVRCDNNWVSNGNSFIILRKFEIPDVCYFDNTTEPVYDATMLTKNELEAWTEQVGKALKDNNVENASRDMLPPENWKKLQVPT